MDSNGYLVMFWHVFHTYLMFFCTFLRPLGGFKGCPRLVKGSAGVGGGGRNGWKMFRKIEKSNIPHNGEFWGSGDPAGSKERQILHYIVNSRPQENSALSI